MESLQWSDVNSIVIALTANAMDEDEQLYLNVGMDAAITKPFKMNELRMVITDPLAKKRGARLGALKK